MGRWGYLWIISLIFRYGTSLLDSAVHTGIAMRDLVTTMRSRPVRLITGFLGIAVIAVADIEVSNAVPLALLYLLPITLMSTVLRRWQIVILGLFCTFVAEYSDAFPWTLNQGIPRDVLYFLAYTTAGLYVSEALSRRRAEQTHVAELESEIEVRRGVEEQLRLVVANSSIAIISVDESGMILEANNAAEGLFGAGEALDGRQLLGLPLSVFIPSLARVQIGKRGWEQLRTMMQCQAIRASQELFLADVWFSTYATTGGSRLTAMIVDSSTEVRDREEANLEQVLVGSRLAVGALSHEVRNICAAISVVQQNLLAIQPASVFEQDKSKDFDALQQLVSALKHVASVDLSLIKRQATKLFPNAFMRDLYIIVWPSLRESSIRLEWEIAPDLPPVWADQHSLIQVFLNLVRNTEKALTSTPDAWMKFSASRDHDRVMVKVSDNGPGVRDEDQLFRPFAPNHGLPGGTIPSGLGLYLSRAMMRSFHGELRFEPGSKGATFIVELVATEATE
jgi:two-component system sensor kinase FixL